MDKNVKSSIQLTVHGLIQGVGFRPFVHRIASSFALSGWVENRNDSVVIRLEGEQEDIKGFEYDLLNKKPAAAVIDRLNREELPVQGLQGFRILNSKDEGDEVTEVSPDIAVCDECLADMKKQPHRISYPFINCTNCGPRFSIIRDMPYDRANTTMDRFPMCETCSSEYHNVLDRRFHAQPVACHTCGPHYTFYTGKQRVNNFPLILESVSAKIDGGEIILAKGLGGFFLACDALNQNAVGRLRNIKRRYGKPFAVMFRDTEAIRNHASLSTVEECKLKDWTRPILLVNASHLLPDEVGAGFPSIGAMLPYLPFHYQLFEKLKTYAIIFTSGNFSEEPIVTDDQVALESFNGKVDGILVSNRPIYNRVDDSVGHVVNGSFRLLRRSRGFVPGRIKMNMDCDRLLAAGAELVNCFCIGKGNTAILSQHIGDLKNMETLEFYEESIARFKKLFRVEPVAVAHDLHPDYLSTRIAMELGLPALAVQHHHAHIASCMAEHRLDGKVIGISLDGTGLGDDGNIWGSEFFICDLEEYERYSHFNYMPMPGGDLAVDKPWRMALSFLYNLYGGEWSKTGLPFFEKIDETEMYLVIESINKKINAPLTSGAGRLFDAVSVLLGLLLESGFHAEAPMRLEAIASSAENGSYPVRTGRVIFFNEMFHQIIDDIRRGIPAPVISAKFHNTVVSVITGMAERLREEYQINRVVLSGGLFQNKIILGKAENQLKNLNFNTFSHSQIPTNDGGIALGQLAILAKKRRELCV